MKQAGAPCPKCRWHPCAEFQMKDVPAQWRCPNCEAGGVIFDPLKAKEPPPPAAPPPKKHWKG